MESNLRLPVETEIAAPAATPPLPWLKRPFLEPQLSLPSDVLETTKFFFIADSSNLFGGEGEV